MEEHFYFFLAFLLLLLSSSRPGNSFRLIPILFVLSALLCLGLRLITSWRPTYAHQTNLFPTHLRLDSLFFGVFLAYLYHRHPDRLLRFAARRRWPLLAAGAFLLVPAFIFPLETTPFIYTYGLTLFYVGSGLLLLAGLSFQGPAVRLAKAVAYAGSHSYSIYLWHMPVAMWITPRVTQLLGQPDNWLLSGCVYLGGSFALGILMAILIEFPVLRLRDRFFPSRARPLERQVEPPAGEHGSSPTRT